MCADSVIDVSLEPIETVMNRTPEVFGYIMDEEGNITEVNEDNYHETAAMLQGPDVRH